MSEQALLDTELPLPIRSALNRAVWRTQGRYEAIEKVRDEQLSIEEIQAELQELEARLTDPQRAHGSMGPRTGPRRYAEGYWAGLRDALVIMTGGEIEAAPVYPSPSEFAAPSQNGPGRTKRESSG